MSEADKLKAKWEKEDKARAIATVQDSILIIVNCLLPFTDKWRAYIIKGAVEIADRLTPKKKRDKQTTTVK